MSFLKLSFQISILFSVFAVASIHLPVYGQEPHSPALNDRDVGISLYRQGNTQSGIKALSDAVKKDKLDVDAWYYLGQACNATGDSKCARKSLEEVVKLRPDYPEARASLAYALLRLKKMKEAVAEAERALAMRPGQELAHHVIGTVRLHQKSYLAATEQADAALKLTPTYPPALLLKSQALFGLYLDEISVQVYVEDKQIADAITKRRVAYLADAGAALEQYIQLQPNDKDIMAWQEQLESIRAYAKEPIPTAQVFLGADVTTKVVVKGKPEPLYTEQARGNCVTGTVILRAIFTAHGTVANVRVIRGLPDGLTEMAVAAAWKIKFLPATKNGRPVSMYVQLEYNFNLY